MTADHAELPALNLAPAPAVAAESAPIEIAATPRGRLFSKYVLFFVGLVGFALLINSGLDFWFAYQESKEALLRIQQEKADAAAVRIGEFAENIVRQLGWMTRAQWAAAPLDQRRFDYVGLLAQVPAITEIAELDRDGKEQLKISRIAVDMVGSGQDYSQSPAFIETRSSPLWFSPVYFREGSEPYITLAMSRTGRNAGVTVVDINLKLIWDVVAGLKIGQGGYAYVIDANGKLIAHQDISRVLRDSDFTHLPQVASALQQAPAALTATPAVLVARNAEGASVLSAHAGILPLGWLVFVEVPLREAFAPLNGLAIRSIVLLVGGFAGATLAAMFLARRMTGPIRAMQEGAARFGAGSLDRRIDIRTGDELEGLAEQFNRMAAALQSSYADLERKVEARTAELGESRTRLSDAIESMAEGFALWDRDDRLIMFNTRSQEILKIPFLQIGIRFEDLIQQLMQRDHYDQSHGEREAWFAERMTFHRDPPSFHEQRLIDGTWLRVSEHRTQDSGTVTTWTDITALKQRENEARTSLNLLQQELDAARELQLGMLPHEFPEWSAEQPVEVYATMEPARDVGGDLYDCFYASMDSFCFLVGDVSGKGAQAAMFMARTRSLVRMAVEFSGDIRADDSSPVRIVQAVNRELCQNNAERMFVTLFFGVLDTRTGALAYINAGHPAPHILRVHGDNERLAAPPEVPLGVLRNARYRSSAARLYSGDALVIYSDGVPETANLDAEMYTTERLNADLTAVRTRPPEEIVRSIKQNIDEFAGDAPKADDVTLFALRWYAAAA